jgi:hypothetical protein
MPPATTEFNKLQQGAPIWLKRKYLKIRHFPGGLETVLGTCALTTDNYLCFQWVSLLENLSKVQVPLSSGKWSVGPICLRQVARPVLQAPTAGPVTDPRRFTADSGPGNAGCGARALQVRQLKAGGIGTQRAFER